MGAGWEWQQGRHAYGRQLSPAAATGFSDLSTMSTLVDASVDSPVDNQTDCAATGLSLLSTMSTPKEIHIHTYTHTRACAHTRVWLSYPQKTVDTVDNPQIPSSAVDLTSQATVTARRHRRQRKKPQTGCGARDLSSQAASTPAMKPVAGWWRGLSTQGLETGLA